MNLATEIGIDTNPADFVPLSLEAMRRLKDKGKPNLVYDFCACLGKDRPGTKQPLMPFDRMPFGMIEYNIEFFVCTNIHQIKEPDDYKKWLETMDTEFPGRFKCLFAGSMWSGCDAGDVGFPLKARVNIARTSLKTEWERGKRSAEAKCPGTEIQVASLKELKKVNPDGRFWIKLDATDVKAGLMESTRRIWNGDVDLGNGELLSLRAEYDRRLASFERLVARDTTRGGCERELRQVVDWFDEDKQFLNEGLKSASQEFRTKFNKPGTTEERLKNLNWEVIEYQTLLQNSQQLKGDFEEILSHASPTSTTGLQVLKTCLQNLKSSGFRYLRDLFKKKRNCATHVLVTMLSDEKRSSKPYAMPVRYVTYHSIKDQFVRDINRELKEEMVRVGLTLAGTVTDGEFCSLRTQGETRPLHLWQVIHDAKESVRGMSKKVLLEMLIQTGVDQNGRPVVARRNKDIPDSVISDLHELCHTHHMNMMDALKNMRSRMVPDGYTPYPFRTNAPESQVDMLKSIVATCVFKSTISYWKERGVDFSMYLYIPEVDPVTKTTRYDRGDHNHIFRRAAKSIRQGYNPDLDYDAFDAALMDPTSGLTHAALVGTRKQSNVDAERLLSSLVAKSLEQHGYEKEAKFVGVIANWHEASDGRGLTQLQRSRYNYEMLNVILDEWLHVPWRRDQYDFSTIDINRPIEHMCGFSRETVIEITTNIESQEHRRRLNTVIGYPEHPRAGGTVDLETFFNLLHRYLGMIFTLRDFKHFWQKIVREFKKRMDNELPFYYWSLNERFSEERPLFDERPVFNEDEVEPRRNPLRLHRLKLNQREDSSIIVAGRAFLPVLNRTTIRHRMHCPVVDPAPVPGPN